MTRWQDIKKFSSKNDHVSPRVVKSCIILWHNITRSNIWSNNALAKFIIIIMIIEMCCLHVYALCLSCSSH